MSAEIQERPSLSTVDDDRGRPAAARPLLRATCWGTRGSIPSPGPDTARFGGNTACLEVRTSDDHCIIFDAGTGIRALGRRLATSREPVCAELFLTHFHWDHIQGMPFFAPLYDARTRLRVHGARQNGVDIETLLTAQMTATHFPVPYHALAATIEFSHLDAEPWERTGVRISALRVRHPGNTYGFRVDAGGVALAYIPDNELVGADYPVGDDWYDRIVEFLGDADVVFHDAMFTESEYPSRVGWGHSTFRQSIELAEAAGVRRLLFFHHAPERTDEELHRTLAELRDDTARRGSALELGMAAEGEELLLVEKP
ncbi:MAG TPA: MBL fold metallo-hydrolase [Longimicrobiales bacterium]